MCVAHDVVHVQLRHLVSERRDIEFVRFEHSMSARDSCADSPHICRRSPSLSS